MADAKHWRAAAATIRNDNAKAIVLLDEELRVVRFLGLAPVPQPPFV
jgi:hypothetical protein